MNSQPIPPLGQEQGSCHGGRCCSNQGWCSNERGSFGAGSELTLRHHMVKNKGSGRHVDPIHTMLLTNSAIKK